MQFIKFLVGIGFCFMTWAVTAQSATQAIRGVLVDEDTQDPLSYVVIEILNFSPPKSATSDERGRFELANIPVGIYKIAFTHPKYYPIIVPELYVNSGQQAILRINMDRKPNADSEELPTEPFFLPPTATVPQENSNNVMVIMSNQPFKTEETSKYPYTLQTPTRILAKNAGNYNVYGEIGLWSRGNNPNSTQWYIEGLPVSVPQHLGGAVRSPRQLSILNSSLVEKSDFITGVFPADYGNTLNGVMDIRLKSGNNYGLESSIGIDVTGVSTTIEGALDKNNNNSFMVGMRAAYLPLLEPLIHASLYPLPYTQDMVFKLNFKKHDSETSIFGLGGFSSLDVDRDKVLPNTPYVGFRGNTIEDKIYGVLGLQYKNALYNNDGSYQLTVGSNYNQDYFSEYDDTTRFQNSVSTTVATTVAGYYNYQPNRKHQFRVGGGVTHYYLKFYAQRAVDNFMLRDYEGHSMLAQLQAQWLFTFNKKLKLNVGVQGQYLLLNNDYGISPRLAMTWQPHPKHRLTFGYNWNHQMHAWETYLNRDVFTKGKLLDKQLKFSQNHHVSLAYHWDFIKDWQLKAEGFYQRKSGLAVNNFNPAMALINHSSAQNLLEVTDYSNRGKGLTYGAELTIKKAFSKGYYGLISAAYLNSKYLSWDDKWRYTEGNHPVVANLVGGKEFQIGKEKNNRFFVDVSYLFKLGSYYTPVALGESQRFSAQILDWQKAYTRQHPMVHHVDLRIGFVINEKKKPVSHRIFVEVHNLLHQKTTYGIAYNPRSRQIEQLKYLGILPNLSYKVNFGLKPRTK